MAEILPTAPLAFIDNFDSDGTNITIPIASLPGLTSDLANPNSGDIRAVITCILDKFVAELALQPQALGGSAGVEITPEVQPNGLTRKTYTYRVLTQPATYTFADVGSYWGG